MVTVTTISQYICEIEKLYVSTHISADLIPNAILLYRGQSNSDYQLLPSIARGGTPQGYDSFLSEEGNLIEAARQGLPSLFSANLSPIDLLATMQHYGIPTRLLDITENPLAALFFACEDNGADGEVLVFKEHDIDRADRPICQAIADSYRLLIEPQTRLEDFYNQAIQMPYFDYRRYWLNKKCLPTGNHSSWIQECCSQPIFVHGASALLRQNAQSGRYILFPNKIAPYCLGKNENELAFEAAIEPLSKDSESIAKRFKVPSKAKKDLLASLCHFGITRSTLFPDSIDCVCGGIKDRVTADSNARKRMGG